MLNGEMILLLLARLKSIMRATASLHRLTYLFERVHLRRRL